MAISLVSRNEDKFDALIIENTFLSVVSECTTSHAFFFTDISCQIAFVSATHLSCTTTFSLFGSSNLAIL